MNQTRIQTTQMQQPKHNQKGLSLVEVLVSMTLMTVLIVAISTPLASLFKVSRDSQDTAEANAIARSGLETARSAWQTYQTVSQNDGLTEQEVIDTNQGIRQLNVASLQRFNQNCVGPELSSIVNQNITFTIYQLDRNNDPIQTLDSSNIASDCANVPIGPTLFAKRIEVSVTNDEGQTTIATHADVAAPIVD